MIEGIQDTIAVSITEISASGCRLLGNCSNVKTGDRIKVIVGNLGPLDATVRWANGEAAGAEYLERLEQAVVSHFAAYCRSAA